VVRLGCCSTAEFGDLRRWNFRNRHETDLSDRRTDVCCRERKCRVGVGTSGFDP